MLSMTNAQADHLARRLDAVAGMLRELAGVHSVRQDAMHLVGEALMGEYHRARHGQSLAIAVEVEQTAADLRARRAPAAPSRPAGLPAPTGARAARILTPRQREAIEAAHTPPRG